MSHRRSLILILVLSICTVAVAEAPSTPGAMTVDRADGQTIEMPLRHTHAEIEISGFVARTTIEQTFNNPFDEPIEAVYTFPLGHSAAVDGYELIIGERVIRGAIQRRQEARQIYRAARDSGRRAALLEQERPNIFTQSVANIEPGHDVTVRLKTIETVPYEKGIYRLTFPLVVGPRYIPGGAAPVLKPGFRSGHDVSIRVTLEAGVPVVALNSPGHRIVTTRQGTTRAVVELGPDDRIPNKDFDLRWTVGADAPEVGLIAHRDGVDGYFALLVQPKGKINIKEAIPKEIILVLDTSGSMSGVPLESSKRFARRALETLGPRDTFNLIRFAGASEVFSERSLPGNETSRQRGRQWIERARGGGGTEMLKGFQAAMEQPVDPGRIRMVIFLTDGYIGNESQILAAIAEVVGETRIYSVGIGSSVNHYLLDRMARLGGGGYISIGPREDPNEALERFHAWVTKPYLADLEIDWGALPVLDSVPERPKDLYSGQTLQVVGRYAGAGEGQVTVRGRLGGSYWEQSVSVTLPDSQPDHAALASVWARHRIRDLMISATRGVSPGIEAEVTAIALEFGVMSRYTSFVAVDETRVVDTDGPPRQVQQALPLPDGVSFKGVFGSAGPPGLAEPNPESSPPSGFTGGLIVAVHDSDGKPLPGATVLITHDAGYLKPTVEITNKQGLAEFPVLRPGRGYGVQVVFPGFSPLFESDIEVEKNETETLAFQLVNELTERVKVVSSADGSTRFSDTFIQDLPVPGRFYQNVLAMAPGGNDADGDGNPNVHSSRHRDFKAVVLGFSHVDPLTGQWMSRVSPNSVEEMEVITGVAARVIQKQRLEMRPDRVLGATLRVLADLAEDGQLSPSEGLPAVAGLLGAQHSGGALSYDLALHALATWALVEAAELLPDEPWVREAANQAMVYLKGATLSPSRVVELKWRGMIVDMAGIAENRYDRNRLVGAIQTDWSTLARNTPMAGQVLRRLVGAWDRGHLPGLGRGDVVD